MSSAVALAVLVTHQPAGSGGRAGRGLQEVDLLPGGGAGVHGAASHASGGGRGVTATSSANDDAGLRIDGGGGGGGSAYAHDPAADFAALNGRAACMARASTSPALVHGWMQRAGPLPMQLLDGPNTPPRHRAYFNWRDSNDSALLTQEVMVDGAPARVARAPPLFPYCRVLVNHAYRTLYLKAPKTGSTSLLTLLGTCTGSAEDKPTCFEPLKPMGSSELYEQLYRDYFVFGVVRNPWTRAVSSYRMLLRYMKRTCQPFVGSWSKVCTNLNSLPFLHHSRPTECMRSKQQGEGFAMHHLIAQAPCLLADGGGWAADYVVRMEALQHDMREVLTQMDRRRSGSAPRLDVEALLAQLTNVNKVHVACRPGLTADRGADLSMRSDGSSVIAPAVGAQGGGLGEVGAAGTAAATAAAGAAAVHVAAAAGVGDVTAGEEEPPHDWLEAHESYCNDAQYYLGPHAPCFDALAAYYAQDIALFGLPTCAGDGSGGAAVA